MENSYRLIFAHNGQEFFDTEKTADAFDITCQEYYHACTQQFINKEYNPATDLLLKDGDERWDMISNIIATGY